MVADYRFNDLSEHSDLVRNAIVQHQILLLDYEDANEKKSRRRILPLGIVFWGQVATLCAWCEMREDYRSFRMDRMLKLKVTGEHFHPRDDRSLAHYFQQYKPEVDTGFWNVEPSRFC